MTKDQLSMLDELLGDDSDRLNSWEINFLEDFHRHRDKTLTDRQEQKLRQIWDKIFGGAKSN